MIISITVGVLVAGGIYLMLQRSMVRTAFGVSLLSHAANLAILTSGVPAWREDPILNVTTPEQAADPLPQAFVLTAIVITMASTILMLALSVIGHNDDLLRAPESGESHRP